MFGDDAKIIEKILRHRFIYFILEVRFMAAKKLNFIYLFMIDTQSKY
jgi:hypothetical protein